MGSEEPENNSWDCACSYCRAADEFYRKQELKRKNMNVYIIALHNSEDLDFYVLDEETWNNLDDREYIEQIHKVRQLAKAMSIQRLFTLIKKNGWTVAGGDTGPLF